MMNHRRRPPGALAQLSAEHPGEHEGMVPGIGDTALREQAAMGTGSSPGDPLGAARAGGAGRGQWAGTAGGLPRRPRSDRGRWIDR